ncbi:MAG: ABC transporter substrate-binding protein [Desulfovibrionaceae bacterium]|nr:ABC transporter substrate-binding protein [Desulfovibrionaceae bacterium]MBF0513692.1 ABC transporter substrate-binding protein [Desulfovibrionaceae bacterium]
MPPPQRFFPWIAALLAAGLILIFAGRLDKTPSSPPLPGQTPSGMYGSYDFGAPGSPAVNIAVQPLWVPTSTLTELMRRDAVLTEQLSELGLDPRFFPFLKGADINAYLVSGRLDAMVGGDMPALTAAAQADVVVAALVNQGFISIMAKRRMQLAELRGKTLGCAFGASAHFALLRALAGAGVEAKDVTFAFMDLGAMPQALRDGRIDAFSSWEPGTTIIRNANPDFPVIHRVGYSGYLYFSGNFANARPEAAKALIAAQLRAMAWMKAKRENLLTACVLALEAAKRFTGTDQGISADEYAELVKSEFLDFVPVPIIPGSELTPDGRLRQAFDFLRDHGLLPAGADWDKTASRFNRDLIGEVLDHPGKYRLGDFHYLLAAP